MLNIEKYRKEIESYDISLDCDIRKIRENCKEFKNCWCISKPCSECRKENIEWLLSECQILDDAEKRYLKGVIRPFRDKVKSIIKFSDDHWAEEYICISIEESAYAILPRFNKGTMYRDMELRRRYTLEELGL